MFPLFLTLSLGPCPATSPSPILGWREDSLENIHSQPGPLDAKSMSKMLLDTDAC